MATTQTTNYGLVKPTAGTGELVSVQAHLDDNWDKIDQDMNRYDWQIFTANGTWNKPARCKRVEVIVVGGGGSGGGTAATSTSQVAGSGGGGGGGSPLVSVPPVPPPVEPPPDPLQLKMASTSKGTTRNETSRVPISSW